MNYFELGFVSKAQALGYSKEAALCVLKRASTHPQFSQVLSKHPELDEEEENTSFTPEALLEQFKQDYINRDIHKKKIKINL
jgi:hypothetical protein